MKEEINAGVRFLKEFLAKYGQLSSDQIDTFGFKLTQLLEKRYANHWYEFQPMKGQAFRCLRLKRAENYIDPVLEQILRDCNLSLGHLGLPNDFTLWIDPGEVAVRFGDQIGYTYTIARFELRSEEDLKENKSNQPSPILLLNTPEKIFDEKLTAFIRQNSSTINLVEKNSNPSPIQKDTESFNDSKEGNTCEDSLANAVASLSVDKDASALEVPYTSNNSLHDNINKSINPRRANSANISICANSINPNFSKENSENRQSYNDSCYYSSSSSSCSSSFEADGNLNWIKNSNLFRSDFQKKSQLFSVMSTSPIEKNNILKNLGQIESSQGSSKFFPNTKSVSTIKNTANDENGSFLMKMDQNTSNMDSIVSVDVIDPFVDTLYPLMISNDGFATNCLAQIFSNENPTNHSEITSSSITEKLLSSTLKNVSGIQSNPNCSVGATSSFEKNINSQYTTPISYSSNLDSSPRSSSKSPKINKKKSVNKEKKKSNKNTKLNVDEVYDSTSKKDDSYCGYVESFPYYYKLNRLYNALAVQKLQTERLKKNGMLNPKGLLTSSLSSSGGGTPTGSRPGSSLSSKIELASSPITEVTEISQQSLRPSSNVSMLSTSLQNTDIHCVQQKNFNKQHQGSPGNYRYFQNLKQNVTAPTSATPLSHNIPPTTNPSKNGFPMTPVNAAISFANHQKFNSKSSTEQIKSTDNFHLHQNNDQLLPQMIPFNSLLTNFTVNSSVIQQPSPTQARSAPNYQTN